MTQKMLVERNTHESRVAVLEDDRLVELFVEQRNHPNLVGSLYKGRVTRVLPGMQAAFVDIGLERDTFLYVSDAGADPESLDDFDVDDGTPHLAREEGPGPSIDDLVQPGQELLVQVVKDPLVNKGARITTHVSLAGRYLVLVPTARRVGVSRRIGDEDERQRLLALVEELVGTDGGIIVRTLAGGCNRDQLEADYRRLVELWERVKDRASRAAAPALIQRDLDLESRVVRDIFSEVFNELWVEGDEAWQGIQETLEPWSGPLRERVYRYDERPPLLTRFGVEEQIEAALESTVELRSGGYLVIHPTEALVAIDVNTGRYVGRRALDDTILQTNLEAVKEVARQLRLRNLGGIIVLDLIDMVPQEHRDQVFSALEAELQKDRAKTRLLSISDFGLVEITRKRSRNNLESILTQACPYCDGQGRIRSVATICLGLRRKLLGRPRESLGKETLLRVHPDVARALQHDEQAILDDLEKTLETRFVLEADPQVHHERFEVSRR